jgi:DGQHR domain-containing protein
MKTEPPRVSKRPARANAWASETLFSEQYLESHKDNYVLTPLVAHVESAVLFDPITEHEDVGLLHIPLTANLVIRDGQHHCAAIQQAITENPELGLDTISIMLIPASKASRKAEVTTALDYTQAKSNWSLRVLHDQENSLAELTKQIVNSIILIVLTKKILQKSYKLCGFLRNGSLCHNENVKLMRLL